MKISDKTVYKHRLVNNCAFCYLVLFLITVASQCVYLLIKIMSNLLTSFIVCAICLVLWFVTPKSEIVASLVQKFILKIFRNLASFITLRAKLSGAVYCNRSCLCVCVCGSVTTITRNCVHRSSPNWVCR